MLLHSLHRRLFQVRPFPFLSGVILDPALDRLELSLRPGNRRAGLVLSSSRPECRSSRAVRGCCACLEIVKPCSHSTASYLCVLVTTLEDGAVIEPSRMPFESSCPSLRLSWN
ncbi:uncharacterized protein LOC144142375 isoform X2 [Haemaphysalis longicornis]